MVRFSQMYPFSKIQETTDLIEVYYFTQFAARWLNSTVALQPSNSEAYGKITHG